MVTISLVMIVKNEEENLSRCLESIYSYVDEIIIVDTGSTDCTMDVAKRFGAKVYEFEWINDFSAARNYALEKSTSDWNIVLDADEYISSNIDNLRQFIADNKNKQVIGKLLINSKTVLNNEQKNTRSSVSRVLPRGVYYTGRIHEQVNSFFPRMDIGIEILHDGYLHSNKTDRNLPLLLLELEENKKDGYILYQIAKQYSLKNEHGTALEFYCQSFENVNTTDDYLPLLIVDLLYCIISSREYELGLDIISQTNELLKHSTDFHFVCGLFYMELVFSDINKYIKYFPEIENEYLRCLEIGELSNVDSVIGTGSFLALYNLGSFYEASNQIDKAKKYYIEASKHGYQKATERLNQLTTLH